MPRASTEGGSGARYAVAACVAGLLLVPWGNLSPAYAQVSGPRIDPIVFRANGTVENKKAGLSGDWKIIDDTTLLVAGRKFAYNSATGCPFSPLEPGRNVGWYILLEEDKQQWLDRRSKSR